MARNGHSSRAAVGSKWPLEPGPEPQLLARNGRSSQQCRIQFMFTITSSVMIPRPQTKAASHAASKSTDHFGNSPHIKGIEIGVGVSDV
jgi:hypothetical protein